MSDAAWACKCTAEKDLDIICAACVAGRLESENQTLRAMLKRVEWVSYSRFMAGNACRICEGFNEEGHGHAEDCELAKLLEGIDG